jgi:hypothetical protein
MIEQIQELQRKHEDLQQENITLIDTNKESLEQMTEEQIAENLHEVKTVTK